MILANIQSMIRPDRKSEPGAPLQSRNLKHGTNAVSEYPHKARSGFEQPKHKPRPSPPVAVDIPPVYEIEDIEAPRPSRRKKETPSGPKKPRKMTAQRVRNIAEHYVSSRECSEAMLRECLERRLKKRLMFISEDDRHAEQAEAEELIVTEVARLVKAGLISDARYAEGRARSGLAAGQGRRRIVMDLSRKGISNEVANDALREASREITGTLGRADIDDDEVQRSAEWEAAETFARKKRFGPYRGEELPEDRLKAQKIWRKEASAMARRGFNVELIRSILEREPEDPMF